MGKVTGYSCDHCEAFSVGEGTSQPKGWISIPLPTKHDLKESVFILCSNKCAAGLFVERANDCDGARLKLVGADSAERRAEGARRAAHTRDHVNKGKVNPDCTYCQTATTP